MDFSNHFIRIIGAESLAARIERLETLQPLRRIGTASYSNIAIDNIATMDIMSRMKENFPAPDSLLPLPPATFHILLALADKDRHGYAIMNEVEAHTNGELKLSAGTLYRSIQRMLEQGLIVEPRQRPIPSLDDERRRYYRITPFGTAVARAEARRLAQLVKIARASGFVPGRA